MNRSSVYQYGNTVRLECNFFDFDGTSVDPQLVKVIIYDTKYKIIDEIPLSSNNKSDVGNYYYDYITEEIEQDYYYEWYGEIDGTPSLKRGRFHTKFII